MNSACRGVGMSKSSNRNALKLRVLKIGQHDATSLRLERFEGIVQGGHNGQEGVKPGNLEDFLDVILH